MWTAGLSLPRPHRTVMRLFDHCKCGPKTFHNFTLKKKAERFRSTFETTYEDYVGTCSTSASKDDDPLVSVYK